MRGLKATWDGLVIASRTHTIMDRSKRFIGTGAWIWLRAFFWALLLTSPLLLLRFCWKLFVHGTFWVVGARMDWGSFLGDASFLSALLFLPHVIHSRMRSQELTRMSASFMECLDSASVLGTLPRVERNGKGWFKDIVNDLSLGILVFFTSFVPYLGIAVSAGVSYHLFSRSLAKRWAIAFTLLTHSAKVFSVPYVGSPALVVYFILSSHRLGRSWFEHDVLDRIADAKKRLDVEKRKTNTFLVFGAVASLMLVVPFVGTSAAFLLQGAAAHVYCVKLKNHVENGANSTSK